MMRYWLIGIGLFTLCSFAQDKHAFTPLFALQGTWARQKANETLYESWEKSSAHLMRGKSYTLSGTDTIMVEIMQLQNIKGKIIFTAIDAQHKEQGPTDFTLTRVDNNSYYFENPQHDYPRRVIYELPANDSLHAWIDGGENEKDSRVDFYFKKIR